MIACPRPDRQSEEPNCSPAPEADDLTEIGKCTLVRTEKGTLAGVPDADGT